MYLVVLILILNIKIAPLLFLLTELSIDSSQSTGPRIPEVLRQVYSYADLSGNFVLLRDGIIYETVRDNSYIIGILAGGSPRPMYDAHEQQVLVRLNDNVTVHITPRLSRRYAQFFPRLHLVRTSTRQPTRIRPRTRTRQYYQ